LEFAKLRCLTAYTARVDNSIPLYDPKGNVLGKEFPPENLVLAVILECEPIAKKFGEKYGNDLAYTLEEVANQKVSKLYGTAPLKCGQIASITRCKGGDSSHPSLARQTALAAFPIAANDPRLRSIRLM
jgi:hypothetical protein